ncbi:MAG: two-component system response regulator HydG [Myxococcota bacterium]|jgi:two-component system response regulator HydG
MPHLLFFRQTERVMEYRLKPGQTTIGRADSCDIALPGSEISRSHCIIEGHGGEFAVADRSRHGTTLNGELVRRSPLSDGDRLGVGLYEIVFRIERQEVASTSDAQPARLHEQLLEASGEALAIRHITLHVTEGPDTGEVLPLRRARATLGAVGSRIVLTDPMLQTDHCRLRVSRGRVMLEPGRGATWLDGHRLRQITPLYPDETFQVGETTLRLSVGEATLHPEAQRFGEMHSGDPRMRRVFGTLRVLAAHDEPVLIIGESGTGKELTARGLHDHSPRAGQSFVPLNCGGLSKQLLQSELFGYEKGAFTGADRRRDGAFQQADGGTLFLDELGELPLDAQATLLRALGGGGVRRVGGFTLEFPDVRVIAATNRDLIGMVRAGQFRQDLFFRLETLFIELPPLRERPVDIAALAERFARQLDPAASISAEALALLQKHRWPGNVRELINVVRRAIIRTGPRLDAGDITFHQLDIPTATAARPRAARLSSDEEEEREYLTNLIARHGGNRSAAARAVQMSRSTLLYRMKKVGIT